MLIIGFLKSMQQAMSNYRSRNQLKALSDDVLNDIAVSTDDAKKEAKKANCFRFLKEIFILSVKDTNCKKRG